MVELVEFRLMGPRDDTDEAHELCSVAQMCGEVLESEIDDADGVGFSCLLVAEGVEPVNKQAEYQVKGVVWLRTEGGFFIGTKKAADCLGVKDVWDDTGRCVLRIP